MHSAVFGNIDKRRLLELARRIEQFREVVPESTAGLSRMSSVPTFLSAFGCSASFEPHVLGDDRKPLELGRYFQLERAPSRATVIGPISFGSFAALLVIEKT